MDISNSQQMNNLSFLLSHQEKEVLRLRGAIETKRLDYDYALAHFNFKVEMLAAEMKKDQVVSMEVAREYKRTELLARPMNDETKAFLQAQKEMQVFEKAYALAQIQAGEIRRMWQVAGYEYQLAITQAGPVTRSEKKPKKVKDSPPAEQITQ